MKVSFFVVVACLNFGGSYYDQTSLSSVLSAFKARLTIPRSKAARVSANMSAPAPASLTTSAPAPAALTTSAPASAALTTSASTEAAPTEVASTEAAPTEVAPTEAAPTEVASTEAAPTEVASTEAAPTEAASAETASPEAAPVNDYIIGENQTSEERLLSVQEISENQDTVPTGVPPSQCATNTFSSPKVGSVHSWFLREVAMLAHAGQILWLCGLTGTMFYSLAATAHLWNVTYELRRAIV